MSFCTLNKLISSNKLIRWLGIVSYNVGKKFHKRDILLKEIGFFLPIKFKDMLWCQNLRDQFWLRCTELLYGFKSQGISLS